MSETYLRGARVTVTATIKDESGDLATPTTVTAETKAPDGTVTDVSDDVTTVSTGVYAVSVDLTSAGTWQVRFESTGVVAVAEIGLIVRQGEFE